MKSIDELNAQIWKMIKELNDSHKYYPIVAFKYKIWNTDLVRYVNIEVEELK